MLWCGAISGRQNEDISVADVHPAAGKLASPNTLANIPRLVTAYFANRPDAADPAQRVAFGTSGHRGSAFQLSFNEAHILAIAQAICLYRKNAGVDGPLFLGIDTHALSRPAFDSALEVLVARLDGRTVKKLVRAESLGRLRHINVSRPRGLGEKAEQTLEKRFGRAFKTGVEID